MDGMMERILDAKEVIKDVAVVTPILAARGLVKDGEVYLKAENLQTTGSFKVRGAYYCISKLTQAEKDKGVIACSAGNHAQGVALAAEKEGIECIICMPESAPISKIQRTEAYGAKVILVAGGFDDALVHARKLEAEHGYTFIHPFDDLDIIAGQGTIGLEINEQMADVDIVLVPVGGGGLLAGIASALKEVNPRCKIYGVEALNAASMKRSIDYNRTETLESAKTIADGIAVKCPGEKTFGYCQRFVDGFITVTESQITLAMLKLLEDYKLLVEGAGATSVAAAMYGKVEMAGKKVVCVASGGNVDVNIMERIILKGLKHTGRVMDFATVLEDKPKQLYYMIDILGSLGANIISIRHDKGDLTVDLDRCIVHVTFEARDLEHQRRVISHLEEQGYAITIE